MGAVCKKRLTILIRNEQYELNKDYNLMENHLYQCIYDILLSDSPEPAKLPALQRYKAKIVRLRARRMENVMLENNSQDKMEDEELSHLHILKMVKRREKRVIRLIVDMQGNNVSGCVNFLNKFVTFSPEISTYRDRPNIRHQAAKSNTTHMSNEVCRPAGANYYHRGTPIHIAVRSQAQNTRNQLLQLRILHH